MSIIRYLLLIIFTSFLTGAFAQQDVEFQLNAHLLQGKNILKVKRDFNDPYLWVLAQNNEVYCINSIDNTIEDFSTTFSAYGNQQFIDIAGRSKDTVFIATNGSTVIEYKKGIFKSINLNGMLSSIAIDASGSYGNSYVTNKYTALFATSMGMYRYNFQTELLTAPDITAPSKIFESSYRTEVLIDGRTGRSLPDTVQKVGLVSLSQYTIYIAEIWLGGNSFGHDLKAAFYVKGYAFSNAQSNFYHSQFWATENGLFQNNWNYSYTTESLHRHYLNGLDIKKITSIYGLINFSSDYITGLIKENILVGTNKGLYFTNSRYKQPFDDGWTAKYTFFHYDPLGEIAINDICVNATSYNVKVCEDGVWVASANGLYLLKPDFGKFFNPQQYQAIQFQNQPFTVTQRDICAGTTTTATVNSISYAGNNVQWYKDGAQLPAQSATELIIDKSGDYYAVLYDPCSTFHVESNHLKVNVISSPTAELLYPDLIQACSGSTINLAINTNSTYQYRWYKDGVLTGNTTGSLNTTQAGKFKYEVSACSGNWVSSKEVEVKFISLATPAINSNKAAYCAGEIATLSLTVAQSPDYNINWLYNGSSLPGKLNSTSISTTDAGSYSVYLSSNLLSCTGAVASKTISFDAIPSLSIQKTTNTTFCNGETVTLKANYSHGNVSWSTGQTTENIFVSTAGDYTATVKTLAGCEVNQTVNVSFFPNPVVSIPDARLCEYSREQITLTAPAGFAKYVWNGLTGSRNFVTNKAGTVTLVVTDANGCTASESITISNYCKDILLPNTFTPNGDGVNDTWQITGLNNDMGTTVKVFNRTGEIVFESRGYPTAWNGQYKGKKLSAGAYYYIITTKSNKQILSGSLTIIY